MADLTPTQLAAEFAKANSHEEPYCLHALVNQYCGAIATALTEWAAVIELLDRFAALDRPKPLPERLADELADFRMVMDHCSEIYMHFSRGRISKPNTLPREVIAVAEDCDTEEFQEECREVRRTALEEAEQACEQQRQTGQDWAEHESRLAYSVGCRSCHEVIAKLKEQS